jgi:CheY-like chemotaxis protein
MPAGPHYMPPASTHISRVLVVDDCEPLRYLKTQYLLEAGFHASQADTGRGAILSVETERPDLVLLDVNLPDMHGSEVCREVKKRWALPVIYTSSVDIPVELHGTADGCLVSLDEESLLEAVRRVLDGGSHPKPPPNGRPEVGIVGLVFAERSSPVEIAVQARVFQSGLLKEVLDNSAAFLVILNRNREIVFYNRAALSLTGIASLPAALGLRLGEAYHCVHAAQPQEGCGTAEFCQTCGAMGTVVKGPEASGKWHIACSATGVEGTYDDLMVTASPIEGKEGFVVCTLVDFSHEKRRQVVERIFFHDILNTAAAVEGCAALLRDELAGGTSAELADMADQSASELLAELRGQQLLSQAGDGRLSIMLKAVGTLDLVRTVASEFRNYSQSKKRTILVDPLSQDLRMETDPAVLSRVLGNMLKNALVATPPDGTVTLGCQATQGGIEFCVHTPGIIPRAAQPQTLPRSLSTKDGSQGLSTYSMKLLTERYLGGTVRFESGPFGSRFVVRYPRTVASAGAEASGPCMMTR